MIGLPKIIQKPKAKQDQEITGLFSVGSLSKLHNLKNKQECEKIKRGKLANEFDLEIKRQGKPIEKNKDTVVPFHLDDEDDDSKFNNKKKES